MRPGREVLEEYLRGMHVAKHAQFVNAQFGDSMNLDSLKFWKTGKEIIESVGKRVKATEQKMKDAQKDIAKLCKKWKLDPKEVIEAGADHERVSAYTTKMENSIGASRQLSKGLVAALQEDVTNLRSLASSLQVHKAHIDNLNRIKNNVPSDSNNALSYRDLESLGF